MVSILNFIEKICRNHKSANDSFQLKRKFTLNVRNGGGQNERM